MKFALSVAVMLALAPGLVVAAPNETASKDTSAIRTYKSSFHVHVGCAFKRSLGGALRLFVSRSRFPVVCLRSRQILPQWSPRSGQKTVAPGVSLG